MLIAKEDSQDWGIEFIRLLNSSTFDEDQRDQLFAEFMEASESEVDDLIRLCLANQIDWFYNGSTRLKDINKQLDRHGCYKGNK